MIDRCAGPRALAIRSTFLLVLVMCGLIVPTGCTTALHQGPLAGSAVMTDGRSATVFGQTRVQSRNGAGCTIGTQTRVDRQSTSPTTAHVWCGGIRIGGR